MITKKERDYTQEAARQEAKQRREYMGQLWLGQLTTTITYKAINLLVKQHRIAMAALPSSNREVVPLEPCSHRFTQVYGLPCSHVILQRLVADEPLRVDDVHHRWLLRKPLHVDEPLLLVNNPDIVQTNRGRPASNHPTVSNQPLAVPPQLQAPEPEPTQASRAGQRRPRQPRQPSRNRGRGTRPLRASVRRNLSQFELDDLASQASEASQSRGQSRKRVRANTNNRARGSTRGRGGRASATVTQQQSQAEEVVALTQMSQQSEPEECIVATQAAYEGARRSTRRGRGTHSRWNDECE
ncbi:hypothetical protein E4U44_000844 [Claviceps purpurea]|nr:hypothetical protein E4U44_000844 [Claviceps purpurea]